MFFHATCKDCCDCIWGNSFTRATVFCNLCCSCYFPISTYRYNYIFAVVDAMVKNLTQTLNNFWCIDVEYFNQLTPLPDTSFCECNLTSKTERLTITIVMCMWILMTPYIPDLSKPVQCVESIFIAPSWIILLNSF